MWNERLAKKIRHTDLTTKDIELIGFVPEFVLACEEMERLKEEDKRNSVRDFFSPHDGENGVNSSS